MLERIALLQLRSGKPLLVMRVACSGLLSIRDAPQFVLRLAYCFANNRISRNAELERRQIMFCPALAQVSDFFPDALRRVAVHQVSVALFGDQLLGRRGLA